MAESEDMRHVWRDGSVIKDTGCSDMVPRFSSQHPLSVSEQTVTPTPEDMIQFSSLLKQCTHMIYAYIYMNRYIHTYVQKLIYKKVLKS